MTFAGFVVADLDAGGVILILIGLFYAFAAIITIRVGAMNVLMTSMLSSLSTVDPREEAAERNRGWLLGAMAVLYGAGGILLALRLDLSVTVFVLSAACYGLYLYWFAPVFLDPWDPPEEPGRSGTRNAFFVYLGATLIVLAAWHSGALRRTADENPLVLAGAAVLVAALAGYALRAYSPWRRYPKIVRTDDPDRWTPLPQKLILTPSWEGISLIDGDSGEPVWQSLSPEDMPDADWQDVTAWNDLFREMGDPDDPLGQRFLVPDAEDRLEKAGRPIYERLAQRLGKDRISFEPKPRPNRSRFEFPACRIFIDANGDPLQRLDEAGEHHYLSLVLAGLSWNLANALGDWAYRYSTFRNPQDHDGPRTWTAQEEATHRAEGRALGERLARELAATGRGHVVVWYDPYGEGAERINA